jgi:hypothetical protein
MLHDISWTDRIDLRLQNSSGRSGQISTEGAEFPTSSIIAGYGKTSQIQRFPFRTYYSELDRLVSESDAVLFLGYGFGDTHLNHAFAKYRDERKRPVVIIDYADDEKMAAFGGGLGDMPQVLAHAMRIFNTENSSMSWGNCRSPYTVGDIKKANDFESSTEPLTPLSLWYNGMEEACKNPDKILEKLR